MNSGGSKNFEGAEDNVSAPSSFIANTHNELYAFYTGKGCLGPTGKNLWANGGRPPPPPPWIRHWLWRCPRQVYKYSFDN